jgi:GNAT superfamily N-acetyltransferase
VFDGWIETDGPDQRTLVAAREGRAVGLLQVVMLSPTEAWAQGMRVDPAERGRGVGRRLTRKALSWAADAASLGADRTRVLIPEGVRWVSDTAACRVAVSDEPDFVMRADLSAL